MSTREDREQEARSEAAEHPDCIGCRLGLIHNHDDEETRAEQLGADSWGSL